MAEGGAGLSAPGAAVATVNIVISGPGGVGKGTIVEMLMQRRPDLWLSRSWTTRDRRPGEAEDAYVFTDRAAFDAHIAEGGFLEWVEFLDYRQGTPVPSVPEGTDVVFEIDVAGAASILDLDPDALLIFVDTPHPEEQRARLVGRGDSPERVEARLIKGEQERARAAELGMRVVINDTLDHAVDEIAALIDAHRAR